MYEFVIASHFIANASHFIEIASLFIVIRIYKNYQSF